MSWAAGGACSKPKMQTPERTLEDLPVGGISVFKCSGLQFVSESHAFFLHSSSQLCPVFSLAVSVVESPSHVQLFATPWTVARQAPLSMGFFRQEYWSGLPPPWDLPDPGIEPMSPVSPSLAGIFFTTVPPVLMA